MSESNRRDFMAMAAVSPVAIAELNGPSGWPVAMARKEGSKPAPIYDPPAMFYVWVFHPQAEDYVPVGVFNNRADAQAHLNSIEKWHEEHGWQHSCAILELPFSEFVEIAVDKRLKELAAPLRAIAAMS